MRYLATLLSFVLACASSVIVARAQSHKGTKSRKHGRDCALRSLERIFHELADAFAERGNGFGLLPQRLFGFLGCLDRESFARGLLLHGDHLFVGSGDRVDGLRLAVVPLQQLIPLSN